MLQVLAAALVAMALISSGIFELATRDGRLSVSSDTRRVRMMKGEETEVVLTVESGVSGWTGASPTSFSVETGQPVKVEHLPDGTRTRLRVFGRYAGRSQGIRVGVSFTDPLRLFQRLDQIVGTQLVMDTMPLSLLAPEVQRRIAVVGYGEQSSGYAGQGQELYKLDDYNPGSTKDIVWRRVAESSDESLFVRLREASVKDVVRVGVVRFAERTDEERAPWTDMLCEALGEVGREVLEAGAGVVLLYHQPSPDGDRPRDKRAVPDRLRGMTRTISEDIDQLAEAVMSCSVAQGSLAVESVVDEADLVVTGLRELEDPDLANLLIQKPLLLVHEKSSQVPSLVERSVIWTGKEDLIPLIRKTIER